MTVRVDHLVWYCSDLEAGEDYFAQRLGRTPVFGGVHPGQGTRNSLLALDGETYLEILARDPAQDATTALDRELAAIGSTGIYHWAVSGINLEAIIDRAREAGLETSEVVPGQRTRPDGQSLSWRLVGMRNHEFGALMPFFIDWGISEHPSVKAPRAGELADLQLFSPDVHRLAGLYQKLELPFPVNESARPAMVVTIDGGGGRHQLRSIEPLPRGFLI
jgi:hypothetical protein